jgi:hypothetical protein
MEKSNTAFDERKTVPYGQTIHVEQWFCNSLLLGGCGSELSMLLLRYWGQQNN